MKKLMTMTEFVIWIENQVILTNGIVSDVESAAQVIVKYAHFMRKKLTLSMFIPCNEKGEPIDNPEEGQFKKYIESKSYEQRRDEYQKVLDKVLFEGWKINDKGLLVNGKCFIACYITSRLKFTHKTIEEAVNHSVELIPTDTCKKLIGI